MKLDRMDLTWRSPGPVSSQYMRELKKVNILNGPIGAGKTRTNFTKTIMLASHQRRSSLDGERKFKLCVVHANYRQLWRSTLPSWFKLLPKDGGEWTGAENGPAKHVARFQLPDKSVVRLQIDFIAIGENSAEDVMRGYEPTAFFLNELDLLAKEVYTFARGRTGRYPDMSEGGPTWHGILGDCNAPESTAWLYRDMFINTPEHVLLLRQPSGLSAEAENLPNLPPGYYDEQMADQPEWYIERMIKNRPGYSRAGKPVMMEFKDNIHVADRRLDPIPGLPVIVGFDAALNPAAVFLQRMGNGQWRVLDELSGESGTGPERFGEMVAKLLRDRYPGWLSIIGYADPSAAYGVDKKAGDDTWIEIVANKTGIRIDAAPTNSLTPRLEALRRPLTRLIDGKPAILLSNHCVLLREALNSGWHFLKKAGSQTDQFHEEINKNHPFSDLCDGLCYGLSGGGEDREIHARHEANRMTSRQMRHEHDWDPIPS